MKREAAFLAALLVLAIPVLALAQDSGEPTLVASDAAGVVTEDTGLSRAEDVDISGSSTAPVLQALGVLGKGIAVSPGDPMDFMLVKIGLGSVKVTIDGEPKRAAVGVLILDGDRYRLNGVSVADGHAEGDIYLDGEKVGSLDASSVMKDDVEVWAGTMELNGDTYQIYVIEGVRRITAAELRERVADYCQNNPGDTNCRDKVEEFCQDNPNDARCKSIFRKYCIAGSNMDDVRCREYVREYCGDNSTLPECVTNAVRRSRAYCEENPDSALCGKIDDRLVSFCSSNTDNEGCVRAKEILANRTQALNRIQAVVTKRIQDIRATTAERLEQALANVRTVRNEGG